MTKFQDRLRGSSAFDPLGIEAACIEAADMLDECERVLRMVAEGVPTVLARENMAGAVHAVLDKLEGAK